MPKRKKHATALFEVMSHGRAPEPLFKKRSILQSASLRSLFQRPKLFMPKVASSKDEEPVMEAPHPRREEPVIQDVYEPVGVLEAETSHPETDHEPREPREPWLNRFKFKWDLTTGVIAASGLVIVVGLGLLIEHKFRHAPVPTMVATTTTELKKQPPRPSVMDVPRKPAPVQSTSVDQNQPVNDLPEKPSPTSPSQRVINMNYVVIQSFPDEKVARDAADMLNKAGVQCTVVQGLHGWAPSPKWFSIVGMVGFGPRTTGTAEFESYLTKIREAGATFAGKSKWKQFNPQLYRWGADSDK